MSSTSGTSGSYTPKVEIEYQTQETTTTTLEPAPYPSTKIETGAVDTAHNYIEFKYFDTSNNNDEHFDFG